MATKKPAPTKGTPTKTRKPKSTIPWAARYELIGQVKSADPAIPSSVLAKRLSDASGHNLSQQTVASWRKLFGIEAAPKLKASELQAKVDALMAERVELLAEIEKLKNGDAFRFAGTVPVQAIR